MAGLDYLADELSALDAAGLRRHLRRVSGLIPPQVIVDGREAISFCSNDYLGLGLDPRVAAAAAAAAIKAGSGAGGSRLINGNQSVHEELEACLASFHRTEAALILGSGYAANLSVLTALAGPDSLIVSDQLNHASIIDGCRLSRARVEIYRHLDLEHAAKLLETSIAGRRFLVSETIFSMDGDVADVVELQRLCDQSGAALILDEAHAIGVTGPCGRGVAASKGVVPDVLVGGLGKAFGASGGYVVGSGQLREWLVSRARPFIFSTAPSPAVVGASTASLNVLASPEGDGLRHALQAAAHGVRRALGCAPSPFDWSPIVPWHVGDAATTMELASGLLDRGFYVQGIRPPTVPRGTSRLRITVSAHHSDTQLRDLAAALSDLCSTWNMEPKDP